jgi:hypothetical protein
MEKFIFLSSVIKTIHSAFRGNLPWKTDKIVIKWGDFYLEVLLIPFEMTEIYHKFRVKMSFFLRNWKKLPGKLSESLTLSKKSNLPHFFNGAYFAVLSSTNVLQKSVLENFQDGGTIHDDFLL